MFEWDAGDRQDLRCVRGLIGAESAEVAAAGRVFGRIVRSAEGYCVDLNGILFREIGSARQLAGEIGSFFFPS
jgi:hypothetical protein